MSSQFEYSYGKTLLKCENVGLTIDGFKILDDISLEIKDVIRPGMNQGQVIGFLGPSGVGKTKFSEVLSGIVVNDNGNKVEMTGRVLVGENQIPTRIGRIGVVQQSYPLLEHRTVYGNFEVIANNRFKNKKEAKEKIQSTLEMLGLQNHGKYYPAKISGGQRQRVAIGQALIACEDFIIFDEPFSGLDINMISRVLEMLKELTTKNELLTVIVISHDISSTCAISDTLWLMGKNKDAQGNFIPGAKIVKQIDLIERGLAWVPDIALKPEFSDTTREIRAIFPTLG